MTGLIAALDTADLGQASRWATLLSPRCGLLKVGLELFCGHGAAGVQAVAPHPVFLDLKLHDIPTTVAGAVRALLPLRPRMLTLHAAGGGAMLAAARMAVGEAADRPLLLGVTVLTSLGPAALDGTGISGGPRQQVLRLARLAVSHGVDGLVCSPHEVTMLRDALGGRPLLVVPGIRPASFAADDQARTMTPREAAAAGADWLVVGRPITAAADPAAAAAAIIEELAP